MLCQGDYPSEKQGTGGPQHANASVVACPPFLDGRKSRVRRHTHTVILTDHVMSDSFEQDLLSRLARGDNAPDGSDPWASVAATEPDHDDVADNRADAAPPVADKDDKLDEMLQRLHGMAESGRPQPRPGERPPDEEDAEHLANAFVPLVPQSFREADLTESKVEALVLKYPPCPGKRLRPKHCRASQASLRADRRVALHDEERSTGRPSWRGADERLRISVDRHRTGTRAPVRGPQYLFRRRAGGASRLHR